MKLQALAIAIVITSSVAVTVWASQEDGDERGGSRQTRTGVRALANGEPAPFVRDSEAKPAKPGVRGLTEVRTHPQQSAQEGKQRKANERDRALNHRAGARDDEPESQERLRQNRNPVRVADQFGRQAVPLARPGGAYQWGGFAPDGILLGRVNGYRSFSYPYGWGNPYSFGYPYFAPSYYGFGFTPVAFGISGPVTVRYDDPLRRQWKLVDDGIKKLATGSGTPNP